MADKMLPIHLTPIINDLLEKKKNSYELNDYIEIELKNLELAAQNEMDKKENTWEPLNHLFLSFNGRES